MLKIGDTFQKNGIDLLVLDIIDGNPFVIAYNLSMEVKFSDNSNNYSGSNLEKEVREWLSYSGFKTIPREVDLMAMDGYKGYGKISADAAPLTFDEYRKYADILTPHLTNWIWLCTGWGRPEKDNWASVNVCLVCTDGSANYSNYDGSCGLAPAFILDKNYLDAEEEKNPLSKFSISELLAEINSRVGEK